jgi:hypothetical protein
MISSRSMGEHARLSNFLALSLPYLLVFLADHVFLNRHYYDDTASYSLHLWIASSLGWLYSHWAPLFLDAGGGLRTHQPSIPEAQIGAIVIKLMGGQVYRLEGLAAAGIALNALLVLGTAWWGARIAAREALSWPALAAAAALAAVQPGVMFTWSSYPHYVMLLLPAGIALYVLAARPHVPRADETFALVVLGFSLGLQYAAAVPIVAVAVALASSVPRQSWPSLYSRLAGLRVSAAFSVAAIVLGMIFINGLILVSFSLLPRVAAIAAAVRAGSTPAIALVVGAAFGTLGFGAAGMWLLPRVKAGRVLLVVGGRMLVGWGLGANVLMLYAWASGLQATPPQAPVTAGVLLSSPIFCTWMLVPLLLLILGAVMTVLSFRQPSQAAGTRFLGVLTVSVVLINGLVSPGYPTEGEYGVARYLASTVIAVPVVLLWLHKEAPRLFRYGVAVAFAVACATWVQYAGLVRPLALREAALYQQVSAVIDEYRRTNPDAYVLCGGLLGAQCGTAYALDYYDEFHRANRNNAPLPETVGDLRIHDFGFKGNKACRTARECLEPIFSDRSARVLIVARQQYIPQALATAGREVVPGGAFYEPLIIREIELR